MLSEKQRNAIKFAVDAMSESPAMLDRVRSIGPARVIEFIAGNSRHESTRRELAENRDEAERYIAGILGMM